MSRRRRTMDNVLARGRQLYTLGHGVKIRDGGNRPGRKSERRPAGNGQARGNQDTGNSRPGKLVHGADTDDSGVLCRAAGFSDPIDLVFGTGPNDADVIVPTLFTAHNQLIQQAVLLNPYVLVGQLVRAFPAVLKNAAALNTKTTFWSGPNNAGSSHLVVRSRNNVPAPSTPLAPAGPTFSRNASPSP